MKITIRTEPNPEDNAMLQALNSRSKEGVESHLKKLSEVGSGKFMDQYYIGYGHESIGDCGFITVYIEEISMLASKAFQDDPLYNGQESSTRYLDYSTQSFYLPENIKDRLRLEAFLEELRSFYIAAMPKVIEDLKNKYPIKEDEKPTVYEKAIAARAFDILGGFLPCGATTNISWTGSLRVVERHTYKLMFHPLEEVRKIAFRLYQELLKAYPHSFRQDVAANGIKLGDDRDYLSKIEHFYSSDPLLIPSFEKGWHSKKWGDHSFTPLATSLEFTREDEYVTLSKIRTNKKSPIPRHDFTSGFSNITGISYIDFRSYRDWQRHRAGYLSMPIVTPSFGLHPWYFNNLPEDVKAKATKLMGKLGGILKDHYSEVIKPDLLKLNTEEFIETQYIMPMATYVFVRFNYSITQAIYVAELRSSQTVHPTMREIAQNLGRWLEKAKAPVFYDKDPDRWSVKRGSQDITLKKV